MAYFIGVYQSEREESQLACAERITLFLTSLAQSHPGFYRWYKKGTSTKTSSLEIRNTPIELSLLLKSNRRDIGGEAIAELGYQFSAWTGKQEAVTASLAVSCGSFSSLTRNHVVMNFDSIAAPSFELLKDILKSAITAFDPEDGVISTTEFLASNNLLPAWKAPALFSYSLSSAIKVD
jgi:hypothetical protein